MKFPFLFKLISLYIVVIYFFTKSLEGISELGIHGDQNNIEGHSKNLSIKSIFFVLMGFRHSQFIFNYMSLSNTTLFGLFVSLKCIL